MTESVSSPVVKSNSLLGLVYGVLFVFWGVSYFAGIANDK
jgi:hypothetical protein